MCRRVSQILSLLIWTITESRSTITSVPVVDSLLGSRGWRRREKQEDDGCQGFTGKPTAMETWSGGRDRDDEVSNFTLTLKCRRSFGRVDQSLLMRKNESRGMTEGLGLCERDVAPLNK